MNFQDFLLDRIEQEARATEDVLASFLPLAREVLETHRAGLVAPLEGLGALHVEGTRIWFELSQRQPVRKNPAELARIEQTNRAAIEVLAESRRTLNVGETVEEYARLEIGKPGEAIQRPVYLSGYLAWEHEIQHHDPLTDIFSLGLILASLACGLNLNELETLQSFIAARRNLFGLNAGLHPVVAQFVLRMTELDRRNRPQDLAAIVASLENYRDQSVDFEIDLAQLPGLQSRESTTRPQAILTKLRERLFDTSRRNNLLHFRPTMGTLNLTQASIPLLLDIRNIREDQLLVWSEKLRRQLIEGKPISLNKYLNFTEAVYLPSILERIIADARRDQQEFGFAQLRLVLCFLSWANLKVKPAETCFSPLVLLPVKLSKTKGIRDTYQLQALSTEAEVNPVVRHQFRQLYDINVPETIDLAAGGLDSLYEYLLGQIRASEPAVSVNRVDRPRIDLIHEKAKRRLDQYRRNAHVSGRGVRNFLNLDYSYDPANFHPLGVKLFSAKVRTPSSRLREIVETQPRPRTFVTGDAALPPPSEPAQVVETERAFYQLRDSSESNPYLWNFDLCTLTLANLRYRRMSLVRDYEALLENGRTNPAFESTFSLAPRPLARALTAALPLSERYDVVPCDPTQTTAIAEARLANSYIIQGPPGTGKSQTIANLIADFVARGQRVLFVCEKRVAIDVVFARLRQRGLGSLCCVIHDSQTDKKEFIQELKQTYETYLAPEASAPPKPTRDDVLGDMQRHLASLEHFDEGMLRAYPQTGLPLRRLLERCVELRESRPELSPEEYERLPRYAAWWEHRDRLSSLDSVLRDLRPDGVLARHALRLLSPRLANVARPMEAVQSAVPTAAGLLERLVATLLKSGIPAAQWDTLAKSRQLIDYALRVAPLACKGNITLTDAASQRAKDFAQALAVIREAEARRNAAQELTAAWTNKIPPADLPTALEQARQWQGSPLAVFSLAWWRLRKLLRRSYDFSAHVVRPTWVQVLMTLQNEYTADDALAGRNREVAGRFDLEMTPDEADGLVKQLRSWLATLPQWLRGLHAAICRNPRSAEIVERVAAAREIATAFEQHADGVLVDYDRLGVAQLGATLNEIQSCLRQVPQALYLIGELGKLPAEIGRTLREMPLTLVEAEAAIAHGTWEEIAREHRDVGRVQGLARQQDVQRIEALFDVWLDANAAEICSRVRGRFLRHIQLSNAASAPLTPEDREFKKAYGQGRRTLEHEFGKTMRYRSIRELVDGNSGIVVRDLKPVWMMSPLSVSDTLPLADDLVDVVIFDEASQVPLEESVPSLFRGKQVIVVGDEMQLPPTAFFAARHGDDDENEFLERDGESSARYDLGSDSFLNHAAKNLPSTMLGWHYRSRSESLISFSNWAFYDGRLLTVPDQRLPVRDNDPTIGWQQLMSRPLSYHFLEHGVYDKRRNRAEADYIAGLIRELLVERAGLSIGVIAFSEAQQDEINAALERLAQDDEEFRRLLDEELQREIDGHFVGLLVKNLENIQGDERDVIVLSICYGPGPNGKMLMNFGPINQSGGEKRLNVAFSRAKQRMAVVSSIRAGQITNDYNEGANCLKSYLKYAEAISQGDLGAAQRVLSGMSRWRELDSQSASRQLDPVAAEIAQALRARGLIVDEGVGQSHFRVDLAVRRPQADVYQLCVLIDSINQYEQFDALEREIIRPRLLRGFGWQVTTVLAKDWYDHRAQELERLVLLIDAKTNASRRQVRAV